MRLKWWFKANQNGLYRKYNFDPHGYLLRKAQITKSFRIIMSSIKYVLIKKMFVYRLQTNRFKKRLKISFKKKKIAFTNQKKYLKRKKKKISKKLLIRWNYNFWNKFKNNYFNKSFSFLKEKKYSSFFFLKIFWQNTQNRFTKLFILNKKLKKFFKKYYRKRIRRVTARSMAKSKKKKLLKRLTWLRVIKYRKKKKAWWLLRITNKKAAFFYGIVQLKKFRYINKLNNRNMPLTSYYYYKLDSMINIVLFRLNVFDNIYIVNNFIRMSGDVLVNNKQVLYPFRFVKVGDVISFKFTSFKKMFNIFYKRSKFNRSFVLKKMLNSKLKYKPSSLKLLKMTKNFLNVPSHIEYNYKIMHFILWRLPHENEFLNLNYKHFNTYIWSFETQLQYN